MKHPSLRWTSSVTWTHPQFIWFSLIITSCPLAPVNSLQPQSTAVTVLIIIREFHQQKLLLHCSFSESYFIAFVCCTKPEWPTSIDNNYLSQLPSSPSFLTSSRWARCFTQQPIQGLNNNNNNNTKLTVAPNNNVKHVASV